jgi:esterase/lipase
MPFEKGCSGNKNGRPKGAKSRINDEIRGYISDILSEHFTPKKIAENLEEMEVKDRMQFLTKLLDYVTPKVKQMDLNSDFSNQTIVVKLPKLTPEERINEIKELKESLFEMGL